MNTDERRARQIAYLMGELPEAERAEVEAELRADPKAEAEARAALEGVRAWAAEPVPYAPFKMEDLDRAGARVLEAPAAAQPQRRGLNARSFAMTMAAAALFIFALSQVEFTLGIGGTELRWGRGVSAKELKEIADGVGRVDAKVADLAKAGEARDAQIRDVARYSASRTTTLEEELRMTAAALYDLQQNESRARYLDVKNLIDLAGIEDGAQLAWMNESEFANAAQDPTNSTTQKESD